MYGYLHFVVNIASTRLWNRRQPHSKDKSRRDGPVTTGWFAFELSVWVFLSLSSSYTKGWKCCRRVGYEAVKTAAESMSPMSEFTHTVMNCWVNFAIHVKTTFLFDTSTTTRIPISDTKETFKGATKMLRICIPSL